MCETNEIHFFISLYIQTQGTDFGNFQWGPEQQMSLYICVCVCICMYVCIGMGNFSEKSTEITMYIQIISVACARIIMNNLI